MESLLLTPGPINVDFKDKKCALYDFGSRDKPFTDLVQSIRSKFSSLVGLIEDQKIVLLQGSSTYGLEAVISGLKGERLMVLTNGSYGDRIAQIAGHYFPKEECEIVRFPEGKPVDMDVVEKVLEKGTKFSHVLAVHLETSTGVVNDLQRLKALRGKFGFQLMIDAVASLGSDLYDFNGIDWIVTSPNKCLQGMPGFCLVIAKDLSSYCARGCVLDLREQYQFMESTGQFRFTPPTHSLAVFNSCLERISRIGLDSWALRFKRNKKEIYNICEKVGLLPLLDYDAVYNGNVCHSFMLPDGVTFCQLYDYLFENGFSIYPGKTTSVKTFRLGSIGNIDRQDVESFGNYLKAALHLNPKISESKIPTDQFYQFLKDHSIDFFAGVPDSLLQDFNNCLLKNETHNYIVPHEGLAVSMASGYHLGTSKIPCVYLQNSGFGNLLNPLLSLTHREVNRIPMLIIIGWRGEPGVKDEPQHRVQGDCLLNLIRTSGFELVILQNLSWQINLNQCLAKIEETQEPVFLVVRQNLFSKYECQVTFNHHILTRYMALEILVRNTTKNDLLCCTTGKASRELESICKKSESDMSRIFLMVGSMGHLGSFCLGLALSSKKTVWCLDGDGSFLMHLGSIVSIGHLKPENMVHVILNNGRHESVGVQPTILETVDLDLLAKSVGYKSYRYVQNEEQLMEIIGEILTSRLQLPILVNVMLSDSPADPNLPRPSTTPMERFEALKKEING
jgi:phosphonopyruvate decarboxylase